MRYLLGFICVLALGVMGCGETAGTGGGGGDGGDGGSAGDGGTAPPEFGIVGWQWVKPCDTNASGQDVVVTLLLIDNDTPLDQLTYSGHVQDCTPDLNAQETTLTCDVNPGARQSEATVTDPQGNEATLLFAPETCVNDCAPGCPGKG